MAEKLFYQDQYMKEFDAKVVKIDGNKIILDKTCFYPRGGGQVGDTGEINGTRVIDTLKNGEVFHIIEGEPSFKEGDEVHCKIDWERRYKIMKLHSSAHIVFYFMQEVFGDQCKPATSGIVDERKDKSDYLFEGPVDPEKIKEVEKKANEFISKNQEIVTWSDENDPDRRYWKCGDYEMPCGGTHPKNTSEIGPLIVKKGKKNPGAGKKRIEITLA